MPKVVIGLVSGYAIGGGHVLHVICDLSIAADNAIFGQTGPRLGALMAASVLAILLESLDKRKLVKSGIYVVNIMRNKP